MITTWKLENNVRSTLFAGINNVATSMVLDQASSPFRDPPKPDDASDNVGVLTLMDSLTAPTKIEIVTYTSWADNGDGTITIGGMSRGAEATVANTFSAGAFAIQAVTAESLRTPLMECHHDRKHVFFPGGEVAEHASIIAGANGLRVLRSNGLQTMVECADEDHSDAECRAKLVSSGDSLYLTVNPYASPGAEKIVLESNYTAYGETGRPLVIVEDLEAGRIESLKGVRWNKRDLAFVSNVTVDWDTHDTIHATLAGNTTLTFINTNAYILTADGCRNLRMCIDVGALNPGLTIAWPANVRWPNGVPPLFNTGTNRRWIIDFYYDGTLYFGSTARVYVL